MTKKQFCRATKAVAYFSGWGGLEIHGVEYGEEDYIYYVGNAWYGGADGKTYHKTKIYYDTDRPYFKHNGARIRLDECITM